MSGGGGRGCEWWVVEGVVSSGWSKGVVSGEWCVGKGGCK